MTDGWIPALVTGATHHHACNDHDHGHDDAPPRTNRSRTRYSRAGIRQCHKVVPKPQVSSKLPLLYGTLAESLWSVGVRVLLAFGMDLAQSPHRVADLLKHLWMPIERYCYRSLFQVLGRRWALPLTPPHGPGDVSAVVLVMRNLDRLNVGDIIRYVPNNRNGWHCFQKGCSPRDPNICVK